MAGRNSNKGGGGGSGSESALTTIYGTRDADLLSGVGGSFELVGDSGDDVYIVDDVGDLVVERRNRGIDEVRSWIDYTLPADVENLSLEGEANLSGTGNDLDNLIIGNGGDNLLSGLAGNDVLIGGGGNDTIDGGAGFDVAVFTGQSRDYAVELLDDGWWRVTHGTGEIDRLLGIEVLRFDDGDFAPTDLNASVAARNDQATTFEDQAITLDVLGNDSGNGLAVSAVSGGTLGMATVNADGTIFYQPAANAFGTEVLTYEIVDAFGGTATATVTITIEEVNDAPVAGDDSVQTLTGQGVTFDVRANDEDADGDALTIGALGTAANGTVTTNAQGQLTYTPDAGFTGTDSFTYTVTDGRGGASEATVTISVGESASDPAATPYYVEALLAGDSSRLNAGETYGSGATVTFAFAGTAPAYYDAESAYASTFQAFSAEQQANTIAVLDMLASYSGLRFVEASSVEDAEMVFGIADIGFSGQAFYPSINGVGSLASDVWLDDSWLLDPLDPGGAGFYILMHEIGHAIGLTHPSLPSGEENQAFTAMSDMMHPTMGFEYASSFMLYDIAAIQYLYGMNLASAAGDDVYLFGDLDGKIQTLWDAGGHDVIDLSAATHAVDLNLAEGAFSSVAASGSDNLAIAFGTTIEDATGGAYDDRITGNDAANGIRGGAGNDILTGGGGGDVFHFASDWGNDTVTDFASGEDLLDLSATQLTFEDLELSDAEGGILVSHAGNSILLQDVAQIGETDFLFA